MRYPEYDDLSKEGEGLQRQLAPVGNQKWTRTLCRNSLELWDDWSENLAEREQIIATFELEPRAERVSFSPATAGRGSAGPFAARSGGRGVSSRRATGCSAS